MAILRPQMPLTLAVFVLTFLRFCLADQEVPSVRVLIDPDTCDTHRQRVEDSLKDVRTLGGVGFDGVDYYSWYRQESHPEATQTTNRIRMPLEALFRTPVPADELNEIKGMAVLRKAPDSLGNLLLSIRNSM